MDETADVEALQRELAALRQRLESAEAIVHAIHQSQVDAFVVTPEGADEAEVLVLGGADRPYRLLIERMQQGAATLARDGTILYSNRRLAEMVGSPRPGLSGSGLLGFVAERDRASVTSLVARGCRETIEFEATLVTENGGELPVQLTIAPLLDPAGLACAVVTDLTHQRAQEQQRERLVQEQVARAAAEQMAGILRETDRRKDVFLATLAHELRSPLAPLRSGLAVLQLSRPDEADFQRTHAMLTRQMETLVRLVDDLLDVGRLSQGKIQLRRAAFDAREAVSRAVETCQGLLADRGHRLELALPEQPVPIEGDEVRVTQVLTNLLNNAAKYTPRNGSIAVYLEVPAGRGEVVFRVCDTGIGIPPDLLGHIFEPFTQAAPGTRASGGGLGIGLTLARNLVGLHGGSISARSDGPGRGSEFMVRLPFAESTRAAGAAAPASGARRQGARVLVVDDNKDAADSLGLLLRRMGHEVRLAHRAMEVQDAVLGFAPDIVLLDIGLPDMDGYDVARRLRSDDRCRHVFIVGLSGFASDADRARARAAGFDEHRAKPIDSRELERLMNRATASRRDAGPPAGGAQAEASGG